MSLTPENSSAGWPRFGERFKTPENSSAGWPRFGERFSQPPDSRFYWIKVGGNVSLRELRRLEAFVTIVACWRL